MKISLDWLSDFVTWKEKDPHAIAERLGQTIKQDDQGRVLVSDDDTAQDDRRRLIAAAQAAAIRGLLAELKQRADFTHTWARARERRRAQREDQVESVV